MVANMSKRAKRPRPSPADDGGQKFVAVLGANQAAWSAVNVNLAVVDDQLLVNADTGPTVRLTVGADRRLFRSSHLFAKELRDEGEVRKERASELTLANMDIPEVVPFTVARTADGRTFTLMRRVDLMNGQTECRTLQAYRSMVDALAAMYDQGVYYFDLKLANLLCDGVRVLITDVAEVLSTPRMMMLARNVVVGEAHALLTERLEQVDHEAELEELCRGWAGTLATFVPSNIDTVLARLQPVISRIVDVQVQDETGALIDFRTGGSVQRGRLAMGAMRGVWAVMTTWAAMTVALELAGYKWTVFHKWELGPSNPVLDLPPPPKLRTSSQELYDLRECAVVAYQATWDLVNDPTLIDPDIDLVDLLEPAECWD
jgi:hypothetical protein